MSELDISPGQMLLNELKRLGDDIHRIGNKLDDLSGDFAKGNIALERRISTLEVRQKILWAVLGGGGATAIIGSHLAASLLQGIF